ncbi:MAG: hypothetical protein HW386_1405 [Gammaproteobacteria bacterium]|nr:hypothetical protein [Gammaproteobacteria bacterium]
MMKKNHNRCINVAIHTVMKIPINHSITIEF